MPTYRFPRPSVTVDAVVFGIDIVLRKLYVLLIRRGGQPYRGQLALPGGFIDMRESLEDAVRRELHEETAIGTYDPNCDLKPDIYLEQLYTFGDPPRDPRGRVISVAYYALVDSTKYGNIVGGSDATESLWEPLPLQDEKGRPLKLAFDHNRVLDTALRRLRSKIRYAPVGFELLPERFTMTQLRTVYEVILGRHLDRSNFAKKIWATGVLRCAGTMRGMSNRPAQLYRINKKVFDDRVANGFASEVCR